MSLSSSLRRVPKWAWALGIIAIILGINAAMAFVNFVTANPTSCLSCHGTGGTPDMSKVSLVHPSYGQVGCVDCHARQNGPVLVEGYQGGYSADPERVSASCQSCHREIPTKEDTQQFKYNVDNINVSHKLHIDKGALCTDCHQNVAHDLTIKPTNRPRMDYCFTCHDSDNVSASSPTTSCTACHASGIPDAAASSPIPWTKPVKAPSATPPDVPHSLGGRSACLACHEAGVAGAPKAPDSHAGRTNDICTACHQSSETGTGTPAPSRTPPTIPHSLDGRSACLACHTSGVAGAPKPPDSHAGRANDTCTSCHRPGGSAPSTTTTTTTVPVTTPATTATVPATTTSKAPAGGPPQIPHSLDGRSACLGCHETGLAGATKVPSSHAGRPNDMCILCHTKTN